MPRIVDRTISFPVDLTVLFWMGRGLVWKTLRHDGRLLQHWLVFCGNSPEFNMNLFLMALMLLSVLSPR